MIRYIITYHLVEGVGQRVVLRAVGFGHAALGCAF